MITALDIQAFLAAGFPDSEVTVTGDDGHHFETVIVSPAFIGKKEIERHRMVYAVLGDKMVKDIHALSIKTEVK